MTDAWTGKTLDGRYVIGRRIGKGGMGVVYEAEHTALARRVAVKLIAAKEAPPAYLERFRREAKLAARITHEHLVHIYDVGTDAETGADYIVMEYVDGRDLGVELSPGPLGFDRAIKITRQLLSALHAIHEAGIIHRDIKPTNVMLTTRAGERDFVKLMDFGIARAVGDTSLTVTGHVVGTPSFMAPEQLRGQDLDHRADLYAVGVTLFAMLAGRLPFEGDTAMLAGAHVFQPPPSLAKVRPGTPPALAKAVECAMAKAPADRFADARAFAEALDARVEPTAETVRSRPPRAPSRAPWIAAAIAGVLAIGGVAWGVRGGGDREEQTAKAPTPAPPRVTPEPVLAPPPEIVTPALDAGAPAPGPDTPVAVPSKGSSAKPAAAGAAQYCQCVPTNAPDIYALCPRADRPLCRCDAADGRSLCATQLVEMEGQIELGCPDRQWGAFHLPGKQGDACAGYEVMRFKRRTSKDLIQGHLNCDACPGVPLDSFRGRPGDACTGFYWRTGEQKAGKLAHCGERS